jgi:hypothetical protein
MSAIEETMAAMEPTTPDEHRMQAAVAHAATGALGAEVLLAA